MSIILIEGRYDLYSYRYRDLHQSDTEAQQYPEDGKSFDEDIIPEDFLNDITESTRLAELARFIAEQCQISMNTAFNKIRTEVSTILLRMLEEEKKLYWSDRFAEVWAIKDLRQRYEAVYPLAQDFVSLSSHYAKTVVLEWSFPDHLKTIQRRNVGGIAGGRKFVHHGMLLKCPHDFQIRPGRYLYGDRTCCHELACKAAGNELVGAIQYSKHLHEDGYMIPMQVSVDFQGFRTVCMPILPISESSIVYGSADAGATVFCDPSVDRILKDVAEQLHLARHTVQGVMLHSAGDIEVHRAEDGRTYLLDLARSFPPECPNIMKNHLPERGNSVMYRMFRPEFLRYLASDNIKFPALSSDGLTGWGQGINSEIHDENLRKATLILLEQRIPQLCERLDCYAEEIVDSINLSVEFHVMGVNMRHLGRVLQLSQNAKVRSILRAEIMGRTFKNCLRCIMRDVHESKQSEVMPFLIKTEIVKFLNALCEEGSFSPIPGFWSEYVPTEIEVRFGRYIHRAQLKKEFGTHCWRILSYFMKHCGITLTESTINDFQRLRLPFRFVEADISGFESRHKTLTLLERSSAFSVLAAAHQHHQFSIQEQRLRDLSLVYINRSLTRDPFDDVTEMLYSVLSVSSLSKKMQGEALESLALEMIRRIDNMINSAGGEEGKRRIITVLILNCLEKALILEQLDRVLKSILDVWNFDMVCLLSQYCAFVIINEEFGTFPESHFAQISEIVQETICAKCIDLIHEEISQTKDDRHTIRIMLIIMPFLDSILSLKDVETVNILIEDHIMQETYSDPFVECLVRYIRLKCSEKLEECNNLFHLMPPGQSTISLMQAPLTGIFRTDLLLFYSTPFCRVFQRHLSWEFAHYVVRCRTYVSLSVALGSQDSQVMKYYDLLEKHLVYLRELVSSDLAYQSLLSSESFSGVPNTKFEIGDLMEQFHSISGDTEVKVQGIALPKEFFIGNTSIWDKEEQQYAIEFFISCHRGVIQSCGWFLKQVRLHLKLPQRTLEMVIDVNSEDAIVIRRYALVSIEVDLEVFFRDELEKDSMFFTHVITLDRARTITVCKTTPSRNSLLMSELRKKSTGYRKKHKRQRRPTITDPGFFDDL